MPGGAKKKTNNANVLSDKTTPKSRSKNVNLATKKAVSPKKAVPKTSKKVSLNVRTLNIQKEVVSKQIKSKSTVLQKKPTKKIEAMPEEIPQTPVGENKEKLEVRGRILVLKTEKQKRLVMWVGVSFFMILIAIYWGYSTTQSIKGSQREWEKSDSAVNWGQLSEELSAKMQEIKSSMVAVNNFASTSIDTVSPKSLESADMFIDNAASSTEHIGSTTLNDLKHELETKKGIVPARDSDYYYFLNKEDLDKLLARIQKIKIGDDIKSIREVLPEPNYSEVLQDRRGVFIANVLTFYVKIFEKDTVSEKYDRYISLEFDKDGILQKINRVVE